MSTLPDALSSPAEHKHRLRERTRSARAERSRDERNRAGKSLTAVLTQLTASARTVACFVSTETEPPTRPFLRIAFTRGLTILLPRSLADGRLDWVRTDQETPLHPGLFGIVEPEGPALDATALRGADIVLVPAAAVDRRGTRLGWGRGYYDRALHACPHDTPVYAVVYDSEVVETVPREPHDRAVTGYVTPSGAFTVRRAHL